MGEEINGYSDGIGVFMPQFLGVPIDHIAKFASCCNYMFFGLFGDQRIIA